MMEDEHASIARYQKAKEYLPIVETVAGLTPVDFDHSAYPEYATDRLAALDLYLKELIPYTKRLVQAANLRQEHYDHFILRNGRAEEPGHKAWREEMNRLAIECQSLVDYWKVQRELAFDKAVITSEQRMKTPIDLSVRNIEYNAKEKPKKNSVARPRLPDVEKKRRKKELKQRKREAEVMVKEAIKEVKPVYSGIKQFHNIQSDVITVKEALVLCDAVEKQIFEKSNQEGHYIQFLYKTVSDTVKNRKELFTRFTAFFYKLYLLKKRNPKASIDFKIHSLLEEFNSIYLYSSCWTDHDMIAGNGMFSFLYRFPDLVADLIDPEMLDICEPIIILISAIIWPWSCEYLIKVCKTSAKVDRDNPLMPLVKDILRYIYPDSHYRINTPYLQRIMKTPNPKISALALYRIKNIRVMPPNRNIKLFKSYFGDYPFSAFVKLWCTEYKKFLVLIGQDDQDLGF